MERKEQLWFWLMVVVALVFNVITLSPLVPWQKWLLWQHPVPEMRVHVDFEKYKISLPHDIEIRQGEFVEFVAESKDVTYGFGVFRPDGTMVFQMQVIPNYENSIVWQFDAPGTYDVRSTEYSGPEHPEMFLREAIRVTP